MELHIFVHSYVKNDQIAQSQAQKCVFKYDLLFYYQSISGKIWPELASIVTLKQVISTIPIFNSQLCQYVPRRDQNFSQHEQGISKFFTM